MPISDFKEYWCPTCRQMRLIDIEFTAAGAGVSCLLCSYQWPVDFDFAWKCRCGAQEFMVGTDGRGARTLSCEVCGREASWPKRGVGLSNGNPLLAQTPEGEGLAGGVLSESARDDGAVDQNSEVFRLAELHGGNFFAVTVPAGGDGRFRTLYVLADRVVCSESGTLYLFGTDDELLMAFAHGAWVSVFRASLVDRSAISVIESVDHG